MRPLIMLIIILATFTYASAYITDDDNPIIVDDAIVTRELCDLNNGTLTIIINTPYTGLEYSIDGGSNYQDSGYFDQLSSGDYLVEVRDDTGCFSQFTIQIVNAPQPIITVEQNCVNDLNKADVDLVPFSEGIFPFSYEWQGPNNSTYSSQNLREVDPGMYSVTVTDRIGCQIDTSFLIEQCCDLSILCNNTDSTFFSCIEEVPEIDAAFLDNVSSNDLRMAESLGISIGESCSDVVITVIDNYDQNQDCNNGPLEIMRTYTIDDGVYTSDCTSIIVVDYFEDPQIIQDPSDIEISCSDDIEGLLLQWVNNLAGADVKTCGNYTVTTQPDIYTIDYSCIGTGDLNVIFNIEDECSNLISFSSSLFVKDNTPPSIECPEAISLLADDQDFDQMIEEWVSDYISSDNCSSATVITDLDLSNIDYECDFEELEVNFSATDDCGNESNCISMLTIGNLYTPIISCPQEIVIECQNDIETILNDWSATAEATGYNNASLAIISNLDIDAFLGNSCVEPTVIEFRIEEACFQDKSCISSVSIEDNVNPIISCPDDIIIDQANVDFSSQLDLWLESSSATDNCSTTAIDNNFDIEDLDFCNSGDLDIQFVATDICGNKSSCVSIISLSDYNTVIECPDPLAINCDQVDKLQVMEEWSSQAYGLQYGTDTIPSVIGINLSNIELSCGITDVVFSVNDDCGESISCVSSISISDITSPTITCPSTVSVDISEINSDQQVLDWLSGVIAEDNCSGVMLTHNWDDEYYNVECTEEITIRFQAVDDCDNLSDCISIITISKPSTIEIACPDMFEAYCNDDLLDQKIMEHLTSTAITSSQSYEIYNDLDFDAINRNCESDQYIDYKISLEDVCGNLSVCKSTLHLLPPPRIYIPNVFTPGYTGNNNVFTVYSNDSVIEVASLTIYDRWGSLIYIEENFPTNDEDYGWDGQFKEAMEKSNVMTYHIIVQGALGEMIDFTGTIQVMK